jgi:cytochrome b
VGHNPLGAWSVFAMLGLLVTQVATGLVADDEISTNGPLLKFVSSATSHAATRWHKGWGQWTVIGLAVLHVVAIAFHAMRRHQNLVAPMLHGDKRLSADVPGSTDNAASRLA